MTIKQIVTAHLLKVGATGLCREGCGCRLDNLIACAGNMSDDCVPAVERGCGMDCVECGGDGCMTPLVESAEAERKEEKQEFDCLQGWLDNRDTHHVCILKWRHDGPCECACGKYREKGE